MNNIPLLAALTTLLVFALSFAIGGFSWLLIAWLFFVFLAWAIVSINDKNDDNESWEHG